MKKLQYLLILTLSFTLFVSFSFSSVAQAQDNVDKTASEEEVEQLAEDLEFLFEEAAIKDEHGLVIGYDFDLLEERFGSSADIELLKGIVNGTADCNCEVEEEQEPVFAPMDAGVDRCIEKKLKKNYGEFIKVSTYTTLVGYITSGKYKSAAKKLLDIGVKGNAVSLVGTLSYYLASCVYEVNGWTGKK